MARPTPHSPSPCIPEVANIACSECVVDCNDAACLAEISDRCTEQCVIVPCDNPEHGDIQCPEGSCESPCVAPDVCPLVSSDFFGSYFASSDVVLQPVQPHAACEAFQHRGITCAQDSCSVACESTCDDPDNCFLVNTVSSVPDGYTSPTKTPTPTPDCSFETEFHPPYGSQDVPQHTFVPHPHSGDWDAAFEAMLCSCELTCPPQDETASHDFFRGPYPGPSPTLSTLASPTESNSLPSTFNSPLSLPAYTPPLYMAQPPAPGHTCLWNGCGSSFVSLEELIAHVNISHLRTFSSHIPEPVAGPSSYLRLSSEALGLSCQWDNCHQYSSTPMNSNSLRLDDALNSLAGHLFQDHLGLQGAPKDHTMITTDHATLPDVGLLAEPNLAQDVEMQVEEERLNTNDQDMPLARSAKQDDTSEPNEPKNEGQSPTTAGVKPSSPTMGATGKCGWIGCERSFANVDDLMSHLTAEHVGSGKNHYECFWNGCERNGQNGFGSKQKVCRHLQVRTSLGGALHIWPVI